MKRTISLITATALVACLSMPALGQSVSSPAGQSYSLHLAGGFTAEFDFGPAGASSGRASFEEELGICSAHASLEWSMSGDGENAVLSLQAEQNPCAEELLGNGVFGDDCPQGWPSVEVGETREVCWAASRVTRLR